MKTKYQQNLYLWPSPMHPRNIQQAIVVVCVHARDRRQLWRVSGNPSFPAVGFMVREHLKGVHKSLPITQSYKGRKQGSMMKDCG
jgi:hypothetical protein